MSAASERSPSNAEASSPLQLVLVVLAVSSFVTANIVAVKVVTVYGHPIPGGAVIYPITFLIADILVEVYGYASARRAIWLGFFANLLFVLVAWLVQILPGAGVWDKQSEYEVILGYTWRLLLAASLSYVVGTLANAVVMSRMKLLTRGRALWARTIASTVVGQGLDSVIFVAIAYAGTSSGDFLVRVALTVWVFKVAYEIALTPVVYWCVARVKAREGRDTYDAGVAYVPFPALRRREGRW